MKIIQTIKTKLFNFSFKKLQFDEIQKRKDIYLYAGDIPTTAQYKKYVGLSLNQSNKNHIKHNVIDKYPLTNNCVNIYQSEDVFEHIDIEQLPSIINEIHRILKPGGIFRLSLPDYKCDILNNRTLKNIDGKLQFDPGGGGQFIDGKVVNGGHVWFPTYETVKEILAKTNFKNIKFYHYYNQMGQGIIEKIDYSIGHVKRTPDHDKRVQNPMRPFSIVVDCIKE